MHIDNVDLNLLRSLEILLEERHISKAATRAHLTQSAMSRTLARLRIACEDELLVRTPRGYELTPRARELQDELTGLMPGLRAMFEGTSFDPSSSTSVVRVAASDYPVAVLGDLFIPLFHAEAPHMSLIITPVMPATFADLDQGRVDLVLTPITAPSHLDRQALFDEDFVCVLSESHPITADRLTVDDLAAYSHVTVGGMHPQQTIVTDQLTRLGTHIVSEIRVPYFSAAIRAVRDTNLIAVMPRRFARRYAGAGLRLVEMPSGFEGFTYQMLWHPRMTNDRTHRWLRGLLIKAAESMRSADDVEVL
ncbi:LysR family transcriptional regulator [Agreia sp.]|uniref:LysR family transcriptional regulator n=1 Tax=Agreia sp. TaxID=1872416 RepID=UPI0035BC128A